MATTTTHPPVRQPTSPHPRHTSRYDNPLLFVTPAVFFSSELHRNPSVANRIRHERTHNVMATPRHHGPSICPYRTNQNPTRRKNPPQISGLFYITSRRPAPTQMVDIIIIHGLDGHFVGDFTHPKTRACWVRDWLPKDVPEARVMSWGYRSEALGSARIGDGSVRMGIEALAEGLLLDLEFARRAEGGEKRPLVVLGYGLGGIIFKKALSLANQRRRLHSATIDAVKGVIFLGTPHSGSGLTAMISSITTWSKTIQGSRKENQPMESTKSLKHDLSEISAAFTTDGRGVPKIYSVHEGRKLGFKVASKESCRLKLPQEELVSLDADQTNLSRFARPEDVQYRQLLQCLRNLIDAIDHARRNKHFEWPAVFVCPSVEREIVRKGHSRGGKTPPWDDIEHSRDWWGGV